MEMDKSEYLAIKETLSDTRKISKEMDISLSEALQLRHLVALRWLCQTKVNEIKYDSILASWTKNYSRLSSSVQEMGVSVRSHRNGMNYGRCSPTGHVLD